MHIEARNHVGRYSTVACSTIDETLAICQQIRMNGRSFKMLTTSKADELSLNLTYDINCDKYVDLKFT